MFTGIIEQAGRVKEASLNRLVIATRIAGEMKPGDSVSVNGVCLTATGISDGALSFDIMPETIEKSSLGQLIAGDEVNIEKPVTPNGLLGGHLVQGHVDGTGQIVSIKKLDGAALITISAPDNVMRYIVDKGFIAIDGISLTVTSRENNKFTASIVSYTMNNTNLHNRKTGDEVNLEADIIAKYVENTLRRKTGRITEDFLKEQGFLS